MATRNLKSSIDALFGADPISGEDVRKLFDLFLKNLETAERKMYTRWTLVILLWLIGFGIAKGALAEAPFLGIKVTDLTLVLVGLPIVLSVLFYGMAASCCGLLIYDTAARQIVKHLWPSVHANDLAPAILPATFLAVEQAVHGLEGESRSIVQMVWIMFLVNILFAAPLACIVHVSYLTISQSPAPMWLSISVIVVAAFIITRTVMLVIQTIKSLFKSQV